MIYKSGMQAVKAMAALAELRPGEHAGAAQLARQTGAPENYLGKLLRVLSTKRLLVSQKGFGGGFRLAKASTDITLFDILQHLEPVERWSGCIMGRHECNDRDACALHKQWAGVRDAYLSFIKHTTIAELLKQSRHGKKRG
jgi:Rrf2 family protein